MMNKLYFTFFFVLSCTFIRAQVFTYNLETICTESGEIPLDSIDKRIDFILLKAIPALTFYLENEEVHSYNELKNCLSIKSFFEYNSIKKVEAKMLYDLLELKYLRKYAQDEWIVKYEEILKTTDNLINLTLGAIDLNPNFSETEKEQYKESLVNSTVASLEDNFIFAGENCSLFSLDQKAIHNNFIDQILVYKPSLMMHLCSKD